MIITIISPHWGVFIHKQMLFYSLFCAIIINDNRVCRVVLPSFSMNGGDVYGKLFFSRLNVFRNVPLSVADVHRFDKQKVAYKVEKPPKLWRDGRIFCLKFSATHLVGGCLSIYIITLFRHFSRYFIRKLTAPQRNEKHDYHNHLLTTPRCFSLIKT